MESKELAEGLKTLDPLVVEMFAVISQNQLKEQAYLLGLQANWDKQKIEQLEQENSDLRQALRGVENRIQWLLYGGSLPKEGCYSNV